MVTPKELGEKLSTLRHEKKLTQRALAEQLHVTDKAISRWERGVGYPDFQLLIKLCEVLGVTVEQLLLGQERPTTENAVHVAAIHSEIHPAADSLTQDSDCDSQKQTLTLADSYALEQKTYQKKQNKKRWTIAVILVVLLIGAVLYLAPVCSSVHLTLLGTYSPLQGEDCPVRVELEGYHQRYLFRADTEYYSGTVSIFVEDNSEPIFSRQFVGSNSAQGFRLIGKLTEAHGAYYISTPIYCSDTNDYGILTCWMSIDFTKLWISRNDDLPGEVIAAADPDVDMARFRARYVSINDG